MLNKFTKMLLVATSVAPILLVMAVDSYFNDTKPHQTQQCGLLLGAAIALVVIAWGVMAYVSRYGERQTLQIKKAKNSDKEVLTFLLAYLLPVVSEHKYLFNDFGIPTIVLLLLICLTVYHSHSFDFNPLLGILGYHFYEVEDETGFPYLLISSTPIKKPCQDLKVVELFDYTFLHIGP